ncbi:MAG TPA: divalent-cation tolerance protein CutA [Gammaproteobacteria bacterium]|nr:divalent-cation tolerance protein CutA [Gammaproteobacteria bacterium]
MQKQAEYLLVMTSCPDVSVAKLLAEQIIERKLAACVNILPQIVSIYQWQGKKEQSMESLLFMKTTQINYQALQSYIVKAHPYELPEVIAVRISDGLPDYLAWIGL